MWRVDLSHRGAKVEGAECLFLSFVAKQKKRSVLCFALLPVFLAQKTSTPGAIFVVKSRPPPLEPPRVACVPMVFLGLVVLVAKKGVISVCIFLVVVET